MASRRKGKPGEKSRYQRFIVETINRQDIKGADYNPRIIDDEAKKRLKKGLKEHGLVASIVWNKKTGHVVGGHQRLSALDSLEGRKDYTLDVCVINVDEREEAALNVQLNNPSMQGTWDLDKLADMTEEFDLDFGDMGFSKLDIDFMFDGDDRFTEMFETPEVEATKEEIEAVKEARASGVERMKDKNSIDWYAMLVFADEDEKSRFFKEINLPPYEQYITLDILKRWVKKNS